MPKTLADVSSPRGLCVPQRKHDITIDDVASIPSLNWHPFALRI